MWEFNITQEQGQRSAKIRRLARALTAVGAEDSSAKTELEGALKWARHKKVHPPASGYVLLRPILLRPILLRPIST